LINKVYIRIHYTKLSVNLPGLMSPIPELQRKATHTRDISISKALISAGFACPFLVPSVFLVRRIHRYNIPSPFITSVSRFSVNSGKIWKRRFATSQTAGRWSGLQISQTDRTGLQHRKFSTNHVHLARRNTSPVRSSSYHPKSK